MNLIVDETNETQRLQSTGNNVGKTTVLRLIDYCLGAKGDEIYKDSEFSGQPNTDIEVFLKQTEVVITLEMVEELNGEEENVISISRNFLKQKQKKQTINGVSYSDEEFTKKLEELIFHTTINKPSFRQMIAKNIRITPERMTNILKVLVKFTKTEEYEALYLFWLGIDTASSAEKAKLIEKRQQEKRFQNRLKNESKGDLAFIEQQLVFLAGQIAELEKQKDDFNLNERYEEDIKMLNDTKKRLNNIASEISVLEERKNLILESKTDLEAQYTNINTQQIALLYEKAKVLIPSLQVSFEQTVQFHNDLLTEKLAYITRELPTINQQLKSLNISLEEHRTKEISLTQKVKKMGVWDSLERIIATLNSLYERKGNLEKQKEYWIMSYQTMEAIDADLKAIDSDIASNNLLMENRITLFNKYFSKMSNILYGEHYLLFQKKKENGYDLAIQNIEGNPSAGKKKGQIAAFDFAYIQFADELAIRCLHFILHDQLENIHDNQLNTLFEVANHLNGQYIVPILRDKVPENIDISPYTILTLSQDDKLFKI
nr:DUF2326 domain-containing protein [uncultured Capnocytophaga sp.]